jgi:predicted nucleic acid-binding protein
MTSGESPGRPVSHPKSSEIWGKVEREILSLPIWLEIGEEVSLATADLQASLRKSGLTIEMPDAIIAATASVHDLVLVTRNVRHFQNVPDLVMENWFSGE